MSDIRLNAVTEDAIVYKYVRTSQCQAWCPYRELCARMNYGEL